MIRDLIARRFPDHQVLAEELGGSATVPPGPCWVFDPIDGTTNFAHGLPIFCASLALEIDGVPEVAAVYDPNRRGRFNAGRGGGAVLNGTPPRVSSGGGLGAPGARPGVSRLDAARLRVDHRRLRRLRGPAP